MILSFHEFQNNLAEESDEFNLIEPILNYLQNKHLLQPIFGAEIEFYLSREISENKLSEIIGLPVKKEKGHNQFEIDILPTSDIKQFISEIRNTRESISQELELADYRADFSPKPHPHDYGSAMHLHLNFIGNLSAEELANILCNYAKQTLQFFLPNKESFARLDSKFMSPTHICWGGNNRTCLVRIPDSIPRRIEHRLAGADIDPIYPIYAMLASVDAGLQNPNLRKYSKIYGNGFDTQYNNESLPQGCKKL